MAAPDDWRQLLPQLVGLPLLPIGAGNDRKAPAHPRTGQPLTGWTSAAYTPAQLAAACPGVIAAGFRPGPDSGDLIAFDIDGPTALAFCRSHEGCDPLEAPTWQVRRDTDADRLKVIWRIPADVRDQLELTVSKHQTKPPSARGAGDGENVATYYGSGQVIVLGRHPSSGGNYFWPDGRGPDAVAEITPEWWGLALEIAASSAPRTGGSSAASKGSSNRGDWRRITDRCPICGRDRAHACQMHRDRQSILCYVGSSFQPPECKPGEVITGSDGQRWAYTGPKDCWAEFAHFRIDRPRGPRFDSPVELRNPQERQREPPPQQPTGRRSWKDRNLRKLSHARAMACFDRCIEVQAARERNTMRRRARLRKAAVDLGIAKYIKDGETSQKIFEAKDRQAGRCFRLIGAEERQAMERPRIEWIIPCLLPAGDLTILGGLPKVGKTRFATRIVASVLNGSAVFGFEPASPRQVVLVTDDQADGDTADGLSELGIWEHPALLWSRNFRLTETDTDALLAAIQANPGALVVIDSLRSISRSLQHGENDPELGAALYDLKDTVIEAGGSLLLIHHCSKAEGRVGTEALSGHSSIAGAGNTVLTLHHLPDDKGRPMKTDPMRRLVRDGRSGQGFDLVLSPKAGTGEWYRVGAFEDWRRSQREAGEEEKQIGRMPDIQKRVMAVLHASGGWLTRRQVCEGLRIEWGDSGKGTEAKNIGRALERLEELKFAESKPEGRALLYRLRTLATAPGKQRETSHSAQLIGTRGTRGTSSGANGSASSTEMGTSGTSSTPPPDEPDPLFPLFPSVRNYETPCGDSLVPLFPLFPSPAPVLTVSERVRAALEWDAAQHSEALQAGEVTRALRLLHQKPGADDAVTARVRGLLEWDTAHHGTELQVGEITRALHRMPS